MMDHTELRYLRLFPLQAAVLFPGMELPLVVFEPRYLQLTQECTASNEPFGVLLLKEGPEVGPNDSEPFDVGSTAHIRSAEDIGDGRISLLAVGGQRFKVRAFVRDNPYLAAEVELLDDHDDMIDPSLVDNVRWDAAALVRQLVAARGGYMREVSLPDEPVALSYQVAQMFQGNPGVQQRLLELPTFDRLWDELELIKNARKQAQERPGLGRSFSPN